MARLLAIDPGNVESGYVIGFHRDIWSAYALAVYAADTKTGAVRELDGRTWDEYPEAVAQ